MPVDPQRVQAAFLAAVECDDSAERAIVLEQRCGNDAELRKRVLTLLKLDSDSKQLPRSRLTGADTADDRSPPYAPGTTIAARYQLLEEIGEGGMGTVWVAQQVDPIRRQVAIKLIKPGMDSRRVMSRFETERQALAMMDHSNIAKVFDGGSTENGRPFFVMEYVRGLAITEFCDCASMTIPERLRLFMQVCEAVHHAHQKGVIHRDLKPSNVLISDGPNRGVPKVIDFGLAKAIYEPLAEDSLPATQNLIMGTPRYMSPEQADLNNFDIDTRTDVYSLGVILYELLTGTTPLESSRLKELSLPGILMRIKEDEPARPSSRLTAIASIGEVSSRRGTDPAQLCRALRGDLDWIVMKALAKERSRRYESAKDLARDLERFLRHEPVAARPPSTAYRVSKFARRHHVALVAAALVLATLISGTIVSSVLAIRATRAGRVAEQQRIAADAARAAEAEQRRIAQQERNEAEKRRATAEAHFRQVREAIDDYFRAMFTSRHLNEQGLEPLRQELLDSALAYYQKFIEQHGNDPTLEIELAYAYCSYGELNQFVGANQRALAPLGEATRRYEQLLRRETATDKVRADAAQAYRQQGAARQATGQMADAETSFRRALEIHEGLAERSPGNIDCQIHVARSSAQLGTLLLTADRVADAEVAFVRALDIFRRLSRQVSVQDHRLHLADAYYRYFALLLATGRLEDAEAAILQATAVYQHFVQEDRANPLWRGRLANAWYHRGHVQRMAGQLQPAETSYQTALCMFDELSRESPADGRLRRSIGGARFYLGLLQSTGGQQDDALRSWSAALDDFHSAAKRGHEPPGMALNVAEVLAQLGRWNEAATSLAASIDQGDSNWKPRCQLAFLEWMAGDKPVYRATCRELVARHSSESTVPESAAIALVCLIDSEVIDDWDLVLKIAQQAATADPSDSGFQDLVAAAQYRTGQREHALATLERSQPSSESARLPSSPQQCVARANRLLGEAILAQIYREVGNEEALATQLAAVRTSLDSLKCTASLYCDDGEYWRIGLAVLYAARELERLQPAIKP